MVNLMKTILTSTPATAAAAVVTTPTVTPDLWEGLSKKIAILQEEKMLAKTMGDCVIDINAKIEKISAKRDELDEL